jgi:hypothetical protein
MRTIATLFFLVWAVAGKSQFSANSTCANAIQICFDNPVAYPATIGAGAATDPADYGCLGSENNPAWFYFQVGTPGTHTLSITNSNNRDLDFILYGPFQNSIEWCDSLTAANTADCSYAGGATETVDFTSTNAGDYYVLLITNFSNLATNVSVVQTAGTGNFNCNFVAPCVVSLLTATPGTCDTLTNQYTLTGQLYTFNPPSTGTVSLNVGEEQVSFSAPFNNPINFSITGLPSDGQTNSLSALFSASANCTGTVTFTAPEGCIPCDVTISSSSPICQGGTLELFGSLDGAIYSWTGPGGFSSNEQNPLIENVPANLNGTISVLVTGPNCVAVRELDVEVIPVPQPEVIEIGNEICTGEILFLSAVNVPGASYTWTGPEGFSASMRNTQINNAQVTDGGDYIVNLSLNGCPGGYDTLHTIVFPPPTFSLVADTVINPSIGPAVIYTEGAAGLSYQWNFTGNSTLIENVIYSSDRDTAIIFWDGGEGYLNFVIVATDENGCTSEAFQQQAHVVINTGLQAVSGTAVQLIPNPAAQQTRLVLPESGFQVTLLDIQGRIIDEFQTTANSTGLATHHLETGIYVVKASKNGLQYKSKLIVQH